MTELTFHPFVTVNFVDGEVQSAVIDWSGSYDEYADSLGDDEALTLTKAFDTWLTDRGVDLVRHELFSEDD